MGERRELEEGEVREIDRSSITERIKEHQRDIKLKYITQSALSEHNIKTQNIKYCLTKRQ